MIRDRHRSLVAALSIVLLVGSIVHTASAFAVVSVVSSSSHTNPDFSFTELSAVSDTLLSPGRLVEYSTPNGSGATLGAVVAPDGKKNWKVLTSSGRTVSIPPKHVKYAVPNGSSVTTKERLAAHEAAADTALEHDKETQGEAVRELYDMYLEELEDGNAVVELTTLADFLLGDDSSLSCHAARTVLALGAERFCFKEVSVKSTDKADQGKNLYYEPRPHDIVDSLRAKADLEAEEESKWSRLKERIDGDNNHFKLEEESDEIQLAFASLTRLGCFANLEDDEAEKEEKATGTRYGAAIVDAKKLLKNLGRKSTPGAAKSLLIATGIWGVHENLDIVRLNIATDFSSAMEDMAKELENDLPIDEDKDRRLDLTHLQAFAIDEASTREIDDAISVETMTDENNRQRLWIHIADPTSVIGPGSPLDKEARRRTSTLYLPTGTIPMFPMRLAAGVLCLNCDGEPSRALSVGVVLGEDGGVDLEDVIITPSLVRVSRLTYDQVDQMLDPFFQCGDENNDDGATNISEECLAIPSDLRNNNEAVECLRRLQYAGERRLQYRKEGGSLESISGYELPDMSVKAWRDPDEPDGYGVAVEARERYAASRVVTELMLLANEAVARYGAVHGVPLPFRSQESDEVTDFEIESTPEGPCRSWLAIRSTTRSRISEEAAPHAGLGLDMYVQATSPVRRYADLATHRQLKAHLRGEEELPFTEGDMVNLARDGGNNARAVGRPADDYWLNECLRRRGSDPTEVTVLGGDRWKDNSYKVLLREFGAIVTYKSSRSIEIGDTLDMPCNTLMG